MMRAGSSKFYERTTLGFGIVLLFALCLYPFLVLLFKIALGGESNSGLDILEKVFQSASTLTALKNTLYLSCATAFLSTALALPLSWFLTRTNLRGKKIWRTLFCLPYAIPPYIGAIAWISLTNPSNGLLNTILGQSVFNIYSFGGLVWVMSSFFFTFILLSLLNSLDRMDPSLEEAARLSGAGPGKLFFTITLPLIKPALLSGILLVVLASAASFGVPALIGTPAGIYLLTTKIYMLQKMGSLSGVYQAGALSLSLLALAVLILWANHHLTSKSNVEMVGGKSGRESFAELGKWSYLIQGSLGILWFFLFLLPFLGILLTALGKVQGVLSWDNLGFQNFTRILFEVDETPRAFKNSLLLGVGAATATTILGLVLGHIKMKTRLKGRTLLPVFASLPYSVPGTVVALAFILAFSSHFMGIPIVLYNTLGLIFLAYVAKYLNFSLGPISDAYDQIDDCLAEAARVSGAGWFKTMTTIWVPLLRPSLMASWFLVFMPTFSELTMTVLLSGPGLETLGTVLFQLQEYADASGGGGSVLALIIISFVVAINLIIKLVSKGKYGL